MTSDGNTGRSPQEILEDPNLFTVKLPNKVVFDKIGSALEQLEPMIRAGPELGARPLFIDMTSTAIVSPTGITIIAACLEHLWQQGKFTEGVIRHPRSPLLLRYLQRMNFFQELAVDIEEQFERQDPVGFRPVTHVNSEDESPAVTRDLIGAVEDRHVLDSETTAALKTCVNELLENVFYHAQSPIDALASVQAYTKKAKTELVIVDCGRGIREALAEVPKYAARATDDCSAIRLALEKNVTTTDDPKRGIGLWIASELVRRNEGAMLVLSNEGGVEIGADGVRDVESHFWPGTLVVIEFRMDMPIDVKAVYDSGEFPSPDDDADSFNF